MTPVPNFVSDLRPGDAVTVKFGRHGSQWAIVSRELRGGFLYVRKWRDNSRRWTGNVRIPAIDVVKWISWFELPDAVQQAGKPIRAQLRPVTEAHHG